MTLAKFLPLDVAHLCYSCIVKSLKLDQLSCLRSKDSHNWGLLSLLDYVSRAHECKIFLPSVRVAIISVP